jgi:hypothetical protein
VLALLDSSEDAGEGGFTMTDSEVERVIDKQHKLRALRHARERVRQLERELTGEPARPEDRPHIPEFLRRHTSLPIS